MLGQAETKSMHKIHWLSYSWKKEVRRGKSLPHIVDLGVPRSSRGSGTSKIRDLSQNISMFPP
jgi:hypothetical protein